jgi:branched-chain amino acid transport system ATP-binding protein
MRSVMGLVTLRAGSMRYREREIRGLPPHLIARLGIGLVPEDRRMFAKLTVAENLELGRKPPPTTGKTAWTPDRVLDLFPALRSIQSRKAGNLSGGQQQMVAIARTLMGNPDLLLLDEPGEGLAPVIVEEMAVQLARLRGEGLSMIISEQNLAFARALGDRAYVLETGHIRYSGTLAELDEHQQEWAKFVAF